MFFDDSATFLFAEGDRFNAVDDFIDHVKKELGDEEANWTYDWAVAVDESPGKGGEWVNAGFTSDISKTNKDTSKIHYSEWYYIAGADGKPGKSESSFRNPFVLVDNTLLLVENFLAGPDDNPGKSESSFRKPLVFVDDTLFSV
jgi:hypothetical protein